jgi:succinate-acetate transporter protein
MFPSRVELIIMNRGRLVRSLALGLCATVLSVLNTGCIQTIGQNLLVGFGFSLGALPAQIVADQLFGSFLTGNDNTT